MMTRARRCLPLCLTMAGAFGCRPQAPAEPAPLPPAAPTPEPVPLVPAPHEASILKVELDSAGEAALTLDEHGQVRFWPRLDEQAIPLQVPVNGVETIDLVRASDGWRILTVVDETVSIFAARDDQAPRHVVAVRGRDGALLAGGAFVVVEDHHLASYDRQGRRLGAEPLPEPLFALLTPTDRSAVVAISGTWQDSLALGWMQGTSYAADLGRFDGRATRYVRDEHGAFVSNGDIPIHALQKPSDTTFAVSPGGGLLGFLTAVDPSETEALLFEQADFDLGTTTRLEEGQAPDWWTCSDPAHNEWAATSCPHRDPPKAARRSRARWVKDTVVIPLGRWLHVARGGFERALGAPIFVPQSGTWSPDGTRIAFAINEGDVEEPEGRIVLTQGPLDGSEPATLRVTELDPQMGIAELVWSQPNTLLVAGLEGELKAFEMAKGSPVLVQALEKPRLTEGIHRVEHSRATGLTMLFDRHDARASTLVSRSDDGTLAAGPIGFAGDVAVEQLGLLEGNTPGLWILGPQGLAMLSLDEIRSGPVTPRFNPVSVDPPPVFDVSWDPGGVRVLDWGDRWDVRVDERDSQWLRDVPAFGPLLPNVDGSMSVTLPDCDDDVAAVHPAPAHTLQPGESWALPVAAHTKIRWSPDGSTLLVLGGLDRRYAPARIIDVQTREVIVEFRSLPYEVAPVDGDDEVEPLLITGRCRTPYDLLGDD